MNWGYNMKVKLIGTGAIYTSYNSACTMVDNKIIIDMPNGILKQILKEKINIEKNRYNNNYTYAWRSYS